MPATQWPIRYTNHSIARGISDWPSWVEWQAFSLTRPVYCFYTRIDGVTYELGNINDPRDPDVDDRRFFLHIIPKEEHEHRELIWSIPESIDDTDELHLEFAKLRLGIYEIIRNAQ